MYVTIEDTTRSRRNKLEAARRRRRRGTPGSLTVMSCGLETELTEREALKLNDAEENSFQGKMS